MALEEECPSCGSKPIDQKEASARLSDWFRRKQGASEEDAHQHAAEVVSLLDGAPMFAFGAASTIAGNWWLFALRGVLAIIFGILTFVQPLAAVAAVVLVFGVWAFIDGIHALALAISGWRSWQLVVVGLVGIAVGLLTFFRPGLTAVALYAVVAAWAIARGVLEIAAAIEMRKRIKGEYWLAAAGIASILFGVLMIVLPVAGILAIVWLIGIYALTFGALSLALSVRLRRVGREAPKVKMPIGAPTPLPT